MKKFSLLLSLGVSAFFFACGDDTTENITNNYTSGIEIADKLSDLPKCTADNAGEQYMVKSDADVYACTGKDWKILGGETSTDTVYVSSENITCTTKPLADSSGVNILCNDKVIGSILNGSKGEQGDDGKDGAGCSVTYQTEESVTIKCGDDKFNMNLNGGGEVITPADDIMFLEELQGVAQKGPFAAGSSVLVYELKGDKNLTKTNRFFDGMITSDDGKYSINNISLASPYALLEANGYYLNEVGSSRAYTTSPIKLYAYTDLSDRKKANINVLTHLEYFRVRELMANSDGTLKLTEAKKQAQKEIFAAFGIDAKNFDASEDLNILGTSDQSAALLAVSVLVQSYHSTIDLTIFLIVLGQDIAKDGKWSDAATRAKIADWADSVDLKLRKDSLTLSKIRDNISGWGSMPDFEKYVRNFRNNEYGLGECNESNRSEYKRNTSKTNANTYVCDTLNGYSNKFNWRIAYETEKIAKESCTYAKENVKFNKTIGNETYNFTCKSAKWTGTGKVTYAGQDYNTVIIGDQYWFAENLNYDPGDVSDMSSCAWSGCYDNDPENCKTYGRLYTWEVAINNAACADTKTCSLTGVQQGICPDGWHLPANGEFNTMLSMTGQKIRANSWLSNDDAFGFSLLPTGHRDHLADDHFTMQGDAFLWSSDYTYLFSSNLRVKESKASIETSSYRCSAQSVRCLKD